MMGSSYKAPSGTPNDRSQRSVFVGNISYEIPEEAIRSIFSKAGPVVSIKMVHDRETGKPKGYGFIEFQDVQTAELAIRNLNNYELSGRLLRVDSAAGGMNMEEFNNAQSMPVAVEESPYGGECDAGKAPETIAKCVASLAPEKMFELMKQMHDVVRSNPEEVKQMLTSNPQLAYALLQAQVVMRIIDPQTALNMLHRGQSASQNLKPFHQQVAAGGPTTIQQMPPPQFNMPSNSSLPLPGNKPVNNQPMYGIPPADPMIGLNMGQPHSMQHGQSQQDITTEEKANAQLLMQVMQLSEQDLQMLPAGDREKIVELRRQLKRNVR